MGRPSNGPPFFVVAHFLLPRFYCRVFYCRTLVILNLFQDNVPPLVILKQVQDDEKELGTETPLA